MKEAKIFTGLSRIFQHRASAAPLASAEAFSALYEAAHVSVFRYLYGLSGEQPEDAEDLTAETFARAWKARHSFDGAPHQALGWLMRIGRHLVIDTHRRRQARIQPEAQPVDDLPAGGPSPEETLLAGEQWHLLCTLLGRLPEDQREMLVLRYLLNWRVNQIGAYLDIPENTVSVTIHRALQRLQRDWPAGQE